MRSYTNLHCTFEKLLTDLIDDVWIAALPLSDTFEMKPVAVADGGLVKGGLQEYTCAPFFETEFNLKLQSV